MPTEQQTEKRREIAKRLVNERAAMSGDAYRCDLKLVDAIEAALKTEAERCAALAEESHPQPCTCTVCLIHAESGAAIRRTIRNEDHK